MAELPPWNLWPLIELPLRDHKARMHMGPYLAWVSSRVLDSIYQPTYDEVKRSLLFSLQLGTMPGVTHMERSNVSNGLRHIPPQIYDRFWKVLTRSLCQRFAYLMGKVSKYDNGVRSFLHQVVFSGMTPGETLFGFLQQALLMKFYQPGGIEPALEENGCELVDIQNQNQSELDRRQQALGERATRNARRLEELRMELERVLAGALFRQEGSDLNFEKPR